MVVPVPRTVGHVCLTSYLHYFSPYLKVDTLLLTETDNYAMLSRNGNAKNQSSGSPCQISKDHPPSLRGGYNAETQSPPVILAQSLSFTQPLINEWSGNQTTGNVQAFDGDNIATGQGWGGRLYPYANSVRDSLKAPKLVHIYIVHQLRLKLTHRSYIAPT
jgi:hypothetical protein